MTKKERAEKLRILLDKAYPDAKCSLNYSTPVEMLIATQLSAQCTDARRVNIVTEKLFKRYRSAEDFANADIEELQEYIRSAGFYKTKSKNIIECCKRLVEVYGGRCPIQWKICLRFPEPEERRQTLFWEIFFINRQ